MMLQYLFMLFKFFTMVKCIFVHHEQNIIVVILTQESYSWADYNFLI